MVRTDRREKRPNALRIWTGKKSSENLGCEGGAHSSVPKSSTTMVLAPQIANSTENNQPIVEVKHCNAVGQIDERLRLESKIDLQELVPGERLSREQSMGNRLGFRIQSFKRTEKAKTARAKDDTKEDIISLLYHDDLSEYSSVWFWNNPPCRRHVKQDPIPSPN